MLVCISFAASRAIGKNKSEVISTMSPSLHALDAARKHLVHQLVYFDEHLALFNDFYLSGFSPGERKQMEDMIRRYTEHLTEALDQDDAGLDRCLRTVIFVGSTATVVYDDDASTESFTLVYPTESDPDRNRISFLSPIGRQLLCRQSEHPLVLDIPNGSLGLRIREVKYGYIGGFSSS